MSLLVVISIGAVVALALVASAVWAVWRMTWAHERIEHHVMEIQRLVAEYVRDR